MNLSKLTNHYLTLTQRLRVNDITVEDLNATILRDQQAFLIMKNKSLMTEVEYTSMLVCINEFEDLFEKIIDAKEKVKLN